MNTTPLLALLFSTAAALVAQAAAPPKPQVEIESRFMELPDAVADGLKFPSSASFMDKAAGTPAPSRDSRALSVRAVLEEKDAAQLLATLTAQKGVSPVRVPGVDLLSAPRVTTASQRRAVVEIIREFRYASEWNPPDDKSAHWTPKKFETREVGVTLEVTPRVTDKDAIDLELSPRVVEFLGFVDRETKAPLLVAAPDPAKSIAERTLNAAPGFNPKGRPTQPIFSTRQSRSSVTVRSGQTLVLLGSGESADTKPFTPPSAGRQLLVLVRASTAHPEAAARSAPVAAAPPAKGIPVGKAVDGKPGFVTSPHAPAAGYIDVRGFPAGTEVKCPYTGKTFRVP